jgi:zinc transport system ATP-binding protein
MDKRVVEFQNVNIFYGKRPVLLDVNFRVAQGDKIGIIGPNGSGKTTLVRTIMGVHKQAQGQIYVQKGIRFGYAPQRGMVDIIVPLNVYEYVTLELDCSLKDTQGLLRVWGEKLNLLSVMDKPFSGLSGGQKQRAILLRAMLVQPSCLILDEPTDNLDMEGTKKLLRLVDEYCVENRVTLFYISHYLNAVVNHVDRLMILKDLCLREKKVDTEQELKGFLETVFSVNIDVKTYNGKKIIF